MQFCKLSLYCLEVKPFLPPPLLYSRALPPLSDNPITFKSAVQPLALLLFYTSLHLSLSITVC